MTAPVTTTVLPRLLLQHPGNNTMMHTGCRQLPERRHIKVKTDRRHALDSCLPCTAASSSSLIWASVTGFIYRLRMAHHKPEMPFWKVTNSRLMPFCLLMLKIGLPFRSVTGSRPSADARGTSTSAPVQMSFADVTVQSLLP